MVAMGTATLKIEADTSQFKNEILAIENTLAKIPRHVACRWFPPWTLVRIGWYIGIGLSWWYAFVCLLAWFLRVIFGDVVPKLW